ncbi:hypothetical protein [Thalassospira profundimaris]|nr:hypothetical protein [Thalassospira profundimaris]
MQDKRRIEVAVHLTQFEIDAVTDLAEDWGQSLEEFLGHAAEEKAHQVAYLEDLDGGLSEEEIREFEHDYHDDRLIDFLRDARQHGDE